MDKRRLPLISVLVVALGAALMATAGCACSSTTATNQSQTQKVDPQAKAKADAIDKAISDAQGLISDASKQAEGWGPLVKGYQVNPQLQQLQNVLTQAAEAGAADKQQAAQNAYDALGQALTGVKGAAAAQPANSPEQEGLNFIAASIEEAQKPLGAALQK